MAFETLFFASIGGVLPALIWLWFWLKEDRLHPEPRRILLAAFLGGAIAVPLVIPFQKYAFTHFHFSAVLMFGIWAGIEELFKFIVCWFTALRSKANNEPIDSMIYLITTALGFSAMENIFFLLNPLSQGNWGQAFLTENFRFVGASLLHVASSAFLGCALAFAFYRSRKTQGVFLVFGLILATALHTSFNLLIIRYTKYPAFFAFLGVWVAIIILMLLFEKVKRISPYNR